MPKGQALQNDLQVGPDNQQAPRTTVTQSSGASGMSGANVDISSRSKDTQNLQANIPRMWLPPERCSVCNHVNDYGFNFCQSCGRDNLGQQTGLDNGDDYIVEKRLDYLNLMISSSEYMRKKSALEKQFELFLKSLGKCVLTATPRDVTRFFVLKDGKGKTQIHDLNCKNLGKFGTFTCNCPCRLAAGTVKSYLGQLKSIFELSGRGDKWYDATSGGNPACSLEVKNYLKAIQLEQAKSHVQQKQAKPLFLGKLKSVCEYLDARLQNPSLSLAEKYVVLRDQAFFKLQYFSGDRANDLGLVLIQEVKRFQGSSGIIFSHTVGKTLGNGKVNEFSVFRMEDKVICPVFALERYIEGAKNLGVTIETGYLFRTLNLNRTMVLDMPVSSSTMNDRLKKYLTKLCLYEGETPHGIRGACAITMALSGINTHDAMDHIGWSSNSSFKRYSRISKMVGRGSVGSLMRHIVQNNNPVESVFESLSTTKDF
ncbi:uncharacterized protein LOC127707263 [Mytilus californianus]|uniref:uncharacterized protein LOC127707263 n=1 Tax=Mytilus californianus TaxID=6549 RepID=UPI002247B83D|nr:uncharacterized protein LOC127707263 [Mytilus californianus]